MTTVSVDGTVVVSPKRSWLSPPSLLLPDIPIRATIKLGVRGPLDTGKVGSCLCVISSTACQLATGLGSLLGGTLACRTFSWLQCQACRPYTACASQLGAVP